MRTIRATLIIFLISTVVSSAQTTVDISGRVVDGDSQPLSMANVLLVLGSDTLVRYTDGAGNFSFHVVAAAQVQIITSHVGFATDYRTVDASRNIFIEVILMSSDIQLGEAVITTRSRALIRFSDFGAVRINSTRMEQIPSVLGVPDMIRVLQLMPGVQQSGEANGYLYVRGADPGHNLMLYNRVPVYGMSHLLGIFPFYNADHIDRIYFDKSGSEAQFGNRLSATVQALPPDILPNRLTVKGNIGLVASQATISSPMGNRAGIVISGRQTYIDRIIAPLVYSHLNNPVDDLGYSFSDGNLTLLLRPGDKHSIDLNAFVSGDRFIIGDDGMLLDGFMNWNNHLASSNWNWQLGLNTLLRSEFYFSRYTNFLRVQQASIGLQVQSEVRDWGFESSIEYELWAVPFTSGIRYSHYYVKPQEILSTNFVNNSEADNTANAQYVSAYLQSKPQLSEHFHLDIGLRADFYANSGANGISNFRLSPRISLNFTDFHKWTAYMSYANKNQHMHLITTSSVGIPTDFWMASAEGIPVQQANNFAIGSTYGISSVFELSSGIFCSRLTSLVHYPFSVLQFNEITSFSDYLLTGSGLAYGAEFMLKKTGRLSGWLSYTLSKSDREFDGIDNGVRFLSKFDRRHNMALAMHYEISQRWSAAITQVFASGNRFTAPTSWYFINNNPVKEYGRHNNAQMPNYVRTDMSVDFYIKKSEQQENVLYLSVYNIFAVRNPIYVILDIRASETGNEIETRPRYKVLYSILPSIGWRFRF